MKFYCDACNTKYAISDEKVRGKVLKVRCKKCGNIVTVREAKAPVVSSSGRSSSGSPSSSTAMSTSRSASSPALNQQAAQVPSTNWYYALNGQTFGPFTVDGLREKYKSAEIGDETYVWHEALTAWKPVAAVDAFKNALAIGQQIRPRRKTIGFSGQLEAIRDVDAPSGKQEGFVPGGQQQQKRGPAPSPESSRKAQTPAGRPVKDLRREKLERLRARLSTTASEESSPKKEPAATSAPEPKREMPPRPARPSQRAESRPASSGPQKPAAKTTSKPVVAEESTEWDDMPATEALPSPVGGEALLTFADGVSPATLSSQELKQPPRESIKFDRSPGPAKPSPSSTSDILDQVIGPVDEQSQGDPVDSGVIPFLDEGPQLDGGAPDVGSGPASSNTSGSLLIQIGEIKKEGRGKRWIIGGVAGVLILSLAGVAAILALSAPQTETVAPKEASPNDDHKDELVINTYKRDEVEKIENTVELEDELLFTEEESGDEESDSESPKAKSGAAAAEKKGKEAPRATISAAPSKKKPKPKLATAEEPGSADEENVNAGDEPEEPDDVYKALLAKRAGKSRAVNKPSDPILDEAGRKTGLSKDDARRGFRRVKRSVMDCRERHNRHSARLEAGKLRLSVTVQPTGRVSRFQVKPASVQNTEFERCMQSHKGRWRFAQFNGKEVVINTSIIMQ